MTVSRFALAEMLDANSIPEPNSGCLLWLGASDGHFGYGGFSFGRKRWFAHRAAWTAAHGKIAEGLCVLHKCDVPSCVNPAHLFLGTRADNCRDRARKGRTKIVKSELRTQAKLTDSKVLSIRSDTRSVTAIAADYGVSRKLIFDVKTRRAWRHI